MELKITSLGISITNNSNWDISVSDGIPETIEGDNETEQSASISANILSYSVPLMYDKGNDWTAFLFKEKSLAQIDSQVRENINVYSGSFSYVPTYGINNNDLVVDISKLTINTGAVT